MGLRKISVYMQSAFYILAGINHFVNPEFYYPLIPEYFVFEARMNGLAGFAEILFGVGLLFYPTRKAASYLLIIMLIVFSTSHIYFIQQGSCVDSLCVPQWMGWARLIVIHPFLIWWAWSCGNTAPKLSRKFVRTN
ncbi:MauE/DoxX family redox-associated membrane protein [Ekhidna sp. MALMAid0563]|uniref:DoxX family protein n=1 Tax=Ekhidna sp. MALMAid0563 TaxID=3143937 RepID=UPI0032DF156C